MPVDPVQALRAVRERDPAADAHLIVGVVTTGVYCRPTCGGLTRARDENLSFHADAASARSAGLRACLRCHPDGEPAG